MRHRFPAFTPWTVLVRSALICVIVGVIFFGLGLKKIEPLPIDLSPTQFDATRAFEDMRALSKGFPRRYTWSDQRRKATAWLKQQFTAMGYTPRSMTFSEVIDGKQYTDLENVWVERPGKKHPEDIIVASAHYDITDTTVEGAMDDGSGVGVVMELARIFAREDPDRTMLFLLTDSEEFGAFWGAHAFVRNFDRNRQIVADLNFDFVAPEKQTKVLTLCDGLKTGFTPLWLRELALNSLRSLAGPLQFKVLDFDGFMEFIERALQIPPADHGVFLAEGIPAFNWVGQTNNFAYEMAHYHHTPFDTVEAMRVESFAPFGEGAERVMRSIDALPRIPEDFRNGSYFKASAHTYLEGWTVTLLHILAFIPFLAYSLARFGRILRRRSRSRVLQVLKNEAKNMGMLLGSLLLGYAVMLMMPVLHMVTQYETYPATQKSLLLFHPDFLPMLIVFFAIVGVYYLFQRVFAEPDDSVGYMEIRQSLHAAVMALIIFLAFLKNSYLGILLLLLPAYFWTAIRHRRRTGRIRNILLLLGGAITCVTMIAVMATTFHIGVVYWYLFLSMSYGLISAYSVVLFFMSLTVMIRLFRAILQ